MRFYAKINVIPPHAGGVDVIMEVISEMKDYFYSRSCYHFT